MIAVRWEGGIVAVADDGDLMLSPVDRADEVFAALNGSYVHQESLDEGGTVYELFDPIDRSTPEHISAALRSLPGAIVLEDDSGLADATA